MNRDDVINMAHQSECLDEQHYGSLWSDRLVRFATLISERMVTDGYRQCAVGQKTSQFCGQMNEAQKLIDTLTARAIDCEQSWTTERAERAELAIASLVAALKGVVRVADRQTDEFDAARAALGKYDT